MKDILKIVILIPFATVMATTAIISAALASVTYGIMYIGDKLIEW